MKSIFKFVIIAILTWEARLLLKRTNPKIVTITGNVGKTSTKDAIYSVVKDSIHVRRSEKTFNSDLGVPLTILGLRNAWNNPVRWLKNIIDGFLTVIHPGDYPKLLILEIGVDHPGDMEKLSSWIKPDVVVITRLPDVPTHVEFFDTPESVTNEKLRLLDALKPDGIFVYNHDDEKVRNAKDSIRQQSIGFSRYSLSQFTASADQFIYDGGVPVGLEFVLTHLDTAVTMRVHGSLGVQHAYNYAAAAAVGTIFDLKIEQAMQALSKHIPPPGRMRLLRGIKDTLIVDDSYNSSPTAMERSLQSVKELKGKGRRVAVLGDMLELGKFSIDEHEKVGEQVADSIDVLITVGVRASKIAEGAMEFGMSEKNIYQYDDIYNAIKDIKVLIKRGDIILVKASQSIRAEKLVEDIMLDTDRKDELLVRQNKEWLEKKVRQV